MKLVPDQSQRVAEKEILKGLGFTVVEITPARPSLGRAPPGWYLAKNIGG
jgi:hypothetical protein